MNAHQAPPATAPWDVFLASKRLFVRRLIEDEDGEGRMIAFPLDVLYLDLERGEQRIRFCISYPKGRLVFSDTRECETGSAGSTGLWGTREASEPGKRRTLTPSAWISEVARLIGTERATRIARQLQRGKPAMC